MTATARVRTPGRSPARRPARPATALGLGLALALTAFLPSAAVQAAAIATTTQTKSVPLTDTNWSFGKPADPANPLTYDAFDKTLGTLKSVTVSADYTFDHTAKLTFETAGTIEVGAKSQSITLKAPDGSTLGQSNLADYKAVRTYSGPTFPNTINIGSSPTTGSIGPVTLTTPAQLAMFEALGPGQKVSLPALAAAVGYTTTNSGNGFGQITTQAGANVTVTYSYEPVPEPSTLAVIGLGAAAWLAARRRRLRAGA